ncbi:MAG: hydroxylamine reductase [Eubacteriaceae bacterium]|nr:hydroxylamine reductase [Eubacteriaceae bacterium]
MFCFQCEQTAKGTGCTVNGVCGKKNDTANLQDILTGELIGLARAVDGNTPDKSTHKAVIDGLFTTVTNVNFNDETLLRQIEIVKEEKTKLIPQCSDCAAACSRNDAYDITLLWEDNEDIRSLKSLLLFGMRGMAAYAHHAYALGHSDDTVNSFFYKGLFALGKDKTADELLALLMELGGINMKCMEMLDTANAGAYGKPLPIKVSCNIKPGPFIVISGHDLHDLKLLLEQTDGKGINVYTHSEMLPAHGYPELKKYPHLKGNFGTAWHNQQHEFESIPASILFTTNCIMPVKPSYADRVFTTSVVSFPGMVHIGDDKDFTRVIDKALELGGYKEEHLMTGVNCGDTLTTGFAKDSVLSVADTVIEAVKVGAIKHFFLVGGCDGAKPGRNYYTEFVKQTPKDTAILTLACGKYRFNDLDIGEIGGLPRIIDMGQCNDAYSAIKVAVALSEAFGCGVNDLPLTLVLSWYEQKAVCILLTLLSLGIKNIYIDPSLPAFISPNILNTLVEKFSLTPISTPEADLKKILG